MAPTSSNRRWSRAGLRIWSQTTTPEQVTAALGFAPTKSHHLNDVLAGREEIRRQHHLFVWRPAVSEAEPLATHLAAICDQLEPIANAVHAPPDCNADLFCGYSSENGQGGTTLQPELLERLAVIGLPIVLDLYPPPGDGDELFNASSETAHKSPAHPS